MGTSSAQAIFYIRIYYPALRLICRAWVRCGGFWSGMRNDAIEVKWDAEPSAHRSLPTEAANADVAVERKPALKDYLGNHWIQAGLVLILFGWGPVMGNSPSCRNWPMAGSKSQSVRAGTSVHLYIFRHHLSGDRCV